MNFLINILFTEFSPVIYLLLYLSWMKVRLSYAENLVYQLSRTENNVTDTCSVGGEAGAGWVLDRLPLPDSSEVWLLRQTAGHQGYKEHTSSQVYRSYVLLYVSLSWYYLISKNMQSYVKGLHGLSTSEQNWQLGPRCIL